MKDRLIKDMVLSRKKSGWNPFVSTEVFRDIDVDTGVLYALLIKLKWNLWDFPLDFHLDFFYNHGTSIQTKLLVSKG